MLRIQGKYTHEKTRYNAVTTYAPKTYRFNIVSTSQHTIRNHTKVTDQTSKVRGFKPGRSRRIFQGEKILSTPSFGREVKPFVPCRRFTVCKRSLNVTWKSGIFRQNSSAISCPSSSSFHY